MVGKSHSPILENASIITTSFCRNFFDLQIDSKSEQPDTERLQHHSNLIATLKANQKTPTTAQQR